MRRRDRSVHRNGISRLEDNSLPLEIAKRRRSSRLAWLADGSWLAINLDLNVHIPLGRHPELWAKCKDMDPLNPVCHARARTQGRPGRNPVVALSFTELLERMLDSGGRPFWISGEPTGYGDAEQFTRRE